MRAKKLTELKTLLTPEKVDMLKVRRTVFGLGTLTRVLKRKEDRYVLVAESWDAINTGNPSTL